jgi:hypothetical protein
MLKYPCNAIITQYASPEIYHIQLTLSRQSLSESGSKHVAFSFAYKAYQYIGYR